MFPAHVLTPDIPDHLRSSNPALAGAIGARCLTSMAVYGFSSLKPASDGTTGGRSFSINVSQEPVLSEKIPFFLLALIFGWVAFRAQESANALGLAYFSLPERFAFTSFGLAQYLIKSILPICLSAFYPYPPRLLNGSIPLFYWLFTIPLPAYLIGSYFLLRPWSCLL